MSSPGPVKKGAASSKAAAAAAKAEAPKTPRGRGKAAAAKVAEPVAVVAASTPSKKAPVTPRGAKSATKKAVETPVAAVAAASAATPVAAAASPAAPSKAAAVGVASALNAQSDFDGNTLVPVLVSALWIAGVVNFGLTVACKGKASVWFAATSAVMYAVSSVMFAQYAQKSGDAAAAARAASSWCRLVHALASVATVAYHVTRLGANVWQVGSPLHVHLLNIGFGFAAQEALVFGANLSSTCADARGAMC